MELTLSPRSRSELRLYRKGAIFTHQESLPSLNLMLWTFLLAIKASASLQIAYLVVQRSPLPIRQAHFGQAFPLKHVPFCKLSVVLAALLNLPHFFPFPLRLSHYSRCIFLSSVHSSISQPLAHLTEIVLSLLILFYQATIGTGTLISSWQ